MNQTDSQNEAVLQYLRDNSGITPIHAIKKLGVLRLSARIHDLRAQGHTIYTQMVTHNKKTFAYYRLKERGSVSQRATGGMVKAPALLLTSKNA